MNADAAEKKWIIVLFLMKNNSQTIISTLI